MDDLLIRYILEEASPQELDQVQQWIAANAANRTRFEKLQAVWQLAAQPNRQPVTDPSQALQRLKQTLKERETAPVKRMPPARWIAAAAVTGIAGVAIGAYVWMQPKAAVKDMPPVVQPDTVMQKPVQKDTVPAIQAVPPLPADTVPFVKPKKKTPPQRAIPAQPVRPKKKAAPPKPPADSITVKKKQPMPARRAHFHPGV